MRPFTKRFAMNQPELANIDISTEYARNRKFKLNSVKTKLCKWSFRRATNVAGKDGPLYRLRDVTSNFQKLIII
jgi:hypothetical protein